VTPDSPGTPNPLQGILLKIASVTVFVGMATCIKAAGQVPAGQIVFFRSFFAAIPILALFAFRRELWTGIRTGRPLAHIVRGTFGVMGMGFGFFALTRLPLPEAITLGYVQPLLVVLFSAIFLRETIRIYRWSAVAIGMLGVVIVSWPKFTLLQSPDGVGDAEFVGVIAALVAASIGGFNLLLVRSLVQTDKTATIVLWFSLTASVGGLLTVPFGWDALSPMQAALLVSAGFCGGLGQILMTQAYRHTEASTVAPFEYTSLILGLVIGYFLFDENPTIHMLVGGSIVIGAGIFIIWREQQLGLQRDAARKVSPPQ
jgi:drug/metabolite transporter (DMT)-like permease